MAEDDPKQKCALLMVKLQSPVAPFYLARMLQRTLPAEFIAPCLPTRANTLPSGGAWLHEIKHDGFKIIGRKDGERGPATTSPTASR